MNKSRIIALSAMATALSVILLVLGAFLSIFELSALLVSSIFVMLPLSKKSYYGSFLTVIATAILALLLSGFRFHVIVPYAVFFGFHPIVNFISIEKKLNKWIMLAIKDVWFILTLLLMQVLIEVLTLDIDFLKAYLYPILIVGGGIAFIVYDYLMISFQKQINAIILRLNL